MTEQWRAIPGYEGYYEASNLGQVRRISTGRVLRGGIDSRGYRQVGVYMDGQRTTRLVHLLVAAAFHGPRPEGLETRHLDGDKLNNSAPNLAYGTRSENVRDQVRHGTHYEAAKTHCKHGHEFTPENTRRRARTRRGRRITERRCRTCDSVTDAARYRRRMKRQAA